MSGIPPQSPYMPGQYKRPKKKNGGMAWAIILIIAIVGGIFGFKYVKRYNQEKQEKQELLAAQQAQVVAEVERARDAKNKRIKEEKAALLQAKKEAQAAKERSLALASKQQADQAAKEAEEARQKAASDALAAEEAAKLKAEEDIRKNEENATIDKEMEEIARQEAERRRLAVPILKDPVTGINPIAKIEVYETHKREKPIQDKEIGTWKWDDVAKNEASKDFPSDKSPMTGDAREPYLKLCQEALSAGAEKKQTVEAFYAAADFPGVPEDGAPIIERKMYFNPSVTGWQSTGIYAPPGTTIRISAPRLMTGKTGNWQVRIGCHTDGLDVEKHDQWRRSPRLTNTKTLDKPRTEISNPFGGLVYIVNNSGSINKPPVEVTISGGVEAPLYRLGVTSKSEWEAQLKRSKAPFGEIDCPRVIFTMTTQQCGEVPDVEAVSMSLQKNMQLQDWLSGFDYNPRDLWGPMRFVCDRQISAGAGHSGYPAMGTIDWGDSVATGSIIKSGSWGLWHELGHNHQRAPYRMEGMGEVTVNLFSVINQVVGCDNPLYETRALTCGDNEAAYAFIKGSKSFMDDGDVGVQLSFFAQLMQGLGFELFRSTSLAYLKKPYGDISNEEKWDWLMLTMSEISKKDLTKFFQLWKLPITDSGVRKVKNKKFEEWLPAPNYPESLIAHQREDEE